MALYQRKCHHQQKFLKRIPYLQIRRFLIEMAEEFFSSSWQILEPYGGAELRHISPAWAFCLNLAGNVLEQFGFCRLPTGALEALAGAGCFSIRCR
jgi:hypothetical protein